MSFLSSIKKVLNIGQSDNKKRKNFPYIKEEDPLQYWEIVGELGDGAFGKVHKARKKDDGRLAAAKICKIESDEELTDFTVEIDILNELSHSNIIRLYDAYYYQDQLWVSNSNRHPFNVIASIRQKTIMIITKSKVDLNLSVIPSSHRQNPNLGPSDRVEVSFISIYISCLLGF